MQNTKKTNLNKQKNNTNFIEIKGAKLHNLNNISLKIPKQKLIVISGVSGSGKSSLAFDTLFAEGQRRYIESLSSYARQFLGKLPKPEVDDIIGICPAIAIEQKTTTNNPRSTVGTNTEIYDYLKLLFSRIGKTISPISKKEVKCHKTKDVMDYILKNKPNKVILIISKYHGKSESTLIYLQQQGFSRIIYDNKILKISNLIKEKTHLDQEKIYILIDRVTLENCHNERITDSINTAFYEGKGECIIQIDQKRTIFSNKFELDGLIFERLNTNLFSFNNPYGACKKCEGFGSIIGIDKNKVILNKKLSVYQNVVECWKGEKLSKWKERFIIRSSKFNFPIHRSYNKLSKEEKDILWHGKEKCKGIYNFFSKLESDKYKIQNRVLIARYRGKTECQECSGSGLRKEALYVKIDKKNITEITNMSIKNALNYFSNIKLNNEDKIVSNRIIQEIVSRLNYLNEVGLGYLSLNRKSNTLSGGESQRINIATSIGSSLVGSMYILDEPSIGLHSKDTKRLIKILKKLRDIGNTVVVVEHDEEIIQEADQIIDIGPNAGIYGGNIVFQGTLKEMLNNEDSLTKKYLTGDLNIEVPKKKYNKIKKHISIEGINQYNLKNINTKFPLNTLTLVTGVSGSGKSTLIKEVLKPAIDNYLGKSFHTNNNYKNISVSQNINKVEFVNQKPIGKSSRSNPATYLKVYDDIRKLFAAQNLSIKRKYKAGFFSFNIDGGRCDNCKGEGEIIVEMQFMADVYLECEICKGKRFKKEILEIKYEGKTISDILNLSVEEAILFFKSKEEDKIVKKLTPLHEVGLKYIKLGQSSNTLSGGEAQRIKLASFLSKGDTEETSLFIFDEPTTGLHFHDINKLLKSFLALIKKGHSIICVEHNLDVIKCADWIIDLGPEGGPEGGKIIFEGTVENIINCKESITGQFLKKKIKNDNLKNLAK